MTLSFVTTWREHSSPVFLAPGLLCLLLWFTTAVAIADDQTRVGEAGPLVLGASKVLISPLQLVYLAGGALGRRSSGIHDDLYARCLTLSNGRLSVALVTLDLIGFFYPDVEAVRARLSADDADHLIVAATHNHSAPDVLGYWGPSFLWILPLRSGRDERYVEMTKAAILTCVRDANRSREFVELGFRTMVVRGFSRNIREPNIKDDELTLLRATSLSSKKTLAVLYNFAAHPEILLNGTLITADFPYYVNRDIEQTIGGTAIFMNGALGGMVTVDLGERTVGASTSSVEPTFADAERVSKTLSTAVVEGVLNPDTVVTVAPMRLMRRDVYIPFDNWRLSLAKRLGVLRRELYNGKIKTGLDVFNVGPGQFITVPGEIVPGLGLLLKERMRGDFKFLIGLGNDELGYILPKAEFAGPLFRYERTMSLGPDADTIVSKLSDMLTTTARH